MEIGLLCSVLCALDALIKLYFGTLLLRYPGTQETIFGNAFFTVAIICSCLALGAVGIIGTITVMIDNSKQKFRRKQLNWPELMVSISTILLGVGLAFGFFEENPRVLLGIYAFVLSAIFMIAGLQNNETTDGTPDNKKNV